MPRNNRHKSQYPKSQYSRFEKELKADAALEAAALFLKSLGPKTPCIAYYRIFDPPPPWPGYELAAQRQAVESVVGRADTKIILAYEQPEKPGRMQGIAKHRFELTTALDECQVRVATLVIAKLGRLVWSAPVLSRLAEYAKRGVNFVACDKPNVNHLTIHKLAIEARRKEKARAPQRRAVWAAVKATGYKPGANFTREMQERGHRTTQEKSRSYLKLKILPLLLVARRSGRSLSQTAAILNTAGLTTIFGNKWNAQNACVALKHAARMEPPSDQEMTAAAKVFEATAAAEDKKAPTPTHVMRYRRRVKAPPVSVANAPPNARVERSGLAGRPPLILGRDIIEAEFRRRWAAGIRYPDPRGVGGQSTSKWTKTLAEWFATTQHIPRR